MIVATELALTSVSAETGDPVRTIAQIKRQIEIFDISFGNKTNEWKFKLY